MSRPSDEFTDVELRDEFDWMSEFLGRMAERIRGIADVHSLDGYVRRLEADNAALRELVRDMYADYLTAIDCYKSSELIVINEYSCSIMEEEDELRSECKALSIKYADRVRDLEGEVEP